MAFVDLTADVPRTVVLDLTLLDDVIGEEGVRVVDLTGSSDEETETENDADTETETETEGSFDWESYVADADTTGFVGAEDLDSDGDRRDARPETVEATRSEGASANDARRSNRNKRGREEGTEAEPVTPGRLCGRCRTVPDDGVSDNQGWEHRVTMTVLSPCGHFLCEDCFDRFHRRTATCQEEGCGLEYDGSKIDFRTYFLV